MQDSINELKAFAKFLGLTKYISNEPSLFVDYIRISNKKWLLARWGANFFSAIGVVLILMQYAFAKGANK